MPKKSLVLAAAIICGPAVATQIAQSRESVVATGIPFSDVAPVLQALRPDLLPPEFTKRSAASVESEWEAWVSSRDAAIRARLLQGDEDSVLNLLLLGTTFTKRPRITELADLREPGRPMEIFRGRVDDLLAALRSSRSDERLRFVREVLQARGLSSSGTGGSGVQAYLSDILARVIRETEAYAQAAAATSQVDDPVAKMVIDSRLYSDRGLSSDTSIVPSFALDRTLQDLLRDGVVKNGAVRRVAIIGPGLDVIDRREGLDFYPIQTIQPFLVMDSLLRLGLAASALEVTTFDVSPRVNSHLEAARRQAASGAPYVIELPLDVSRWTPEFVRFWEGAGSGIGTAAPASVPVQGTGDVSTRTVRVRPALVERVHPRDLNIVVQRLGAASAEEQFDLIIATNVLIYYGVFEQALAAANVAHMLRPGAIFLSNNLVAELPRSPLTLAGFTDVVYTPTRLGDRVLWYRRP